MRAAASNMIAQNTQITWRIVPHQLSFALKLNIMRPAGFGLNASYASMSSRSSSPARFWMKL